jgi:hypothetical protein
VLITSQSIKLLEQAGVRWNAKLALTQHTELAKHRNVIRMQMDQLTSNVVQDRNKKLAWRKTKPAHQVRLEINNVDSIDYGKIQSSRGTNQNPWKPPGIMVGGDVLISHHQRLLVLVQRWDLLSHHRMIGHGGGRSRICSIALRSGSTLSAANRDTIGDVGSLISFIRRGWWRRRW